MTDWRMVALCVSFGVIGLLVGFYVGICRALKAAMDICVKIQEMHERGAAGGKEEE